MAKGQIAAKYPAEVELKVGKTYAWRIFGFSGSKPYCDGTHNTL